MKVLVTIDHDLDDVNVKTFSEGAFQEIIEEYSDTGCYYVGKDGELVPLELPYTSEESLIIYEENDSTDEFDVCFEAYIKELD